MAQSPEDEALDALAEALETGLAGTPPGAWAYVRPPDVRRAPIPPPGTQFPKDECPLVYVVPGKGSQLTQGHLDFATKILHCRYDFNVDIYGLVFREKTDEVLADTERLNLRRHVALVVAQNRHLGSLSPDGIVLGGRPEDVDLGEIAPAAMFMLPVTIPLKQQFATVPEVESP